MLSSTSMPTKLLRDPILNPLSSFSSFKPLSTSLPLITKLSSLKITTGHRVLQPIRMGGGPRTYPGGVSKWEWKRMRGNKSKKILKARLFRERNIYEMRKRAELKAAVSELERPWEAVEKPPNLFSVSADEQLKVLADRFQKPGGLDLWSERDGPQLFRPDRDDVPSSRFFPKGSVHSVRPYGKAEGEGLLPQDTKGEELIRKGRTVKEEKDVGFNKGKVERKGNRRRGSSSSGYGRNSGDSVVGGVKNGGQSLGKEGQGSKVRRNSEMFDMSLLDDGKYGFGSMD